MPIDVDVLIVGAGPTGLMLANQLGRRGIRATIIDRHSGPAQQTRAMAVHARTLELIGAGLLDGAYYCVDSPEGPSTHRKPATGMVFDAAREHALELSTSWFVGDKLIDVECGRAAGTRTVLVLTGRGTAADGANADFIARDLAEAADFILKSSDASPR